jgi:hypothetical protein
VVVQVTGLAPRAHAGFWHMPDETLWFASTVRADVESRQAVVGGCLKGDPSAVVPPITGRDRRRTSAPVRVQRHSSTDEALERRCIDPVTVADIDGASRLAIEARVEEA